MSRQRQRGFTLIELMITVVIIGILAAIAYPSFSRYVLTSRRADAQSDMLQIQLGLEKWRANHNTYTSTLSDVYTDDNPHFEYTITNTGASTYTINATAQGGQTGDTGCTAMTLDQGGGRGTAAACWKS